MQEYVLVYLHRVVEQVGKGVYSIVYEWKEGRGDEMGRGVQEGEGMAKGVSRG